MSPKAANAPLNPIFEESGEGLHPLVQASLKVATDAHRYKSDGVTLDLRHKKVVMPYICHPIAAMHILQASGMQEPISLGAALLHDTLEQGKYKRDEEGLRQALSEAVYEAYAPEHGEMKAQYMANYATDMIVGVVREVTNREEMFEHKRFVQADKADKLSKRAKRVKMADHAASLLDDMLYGTTMEFEKIRQMHNRAWAIAKACADARPKLFDILQALYLENERIWNQGEQGPDADTFEIQGWLAEHGVREARQKGLHWLNDAQMGERQRGVISVGFNDQGEVCAYRTIIDPRGDASEYDMPKDINDTAYKLVDEIDRQGNDYLPTAGLPSVHNHAHFTRKITLHSPMKVELFAQLASECDASHAMYNEALVEHARQLRSQARDAAKSTDWRGRV